MNTTKSLVSPEYRESLSKHKEILSVLRKWPGYDDLSPRARRALLKIGPKCLQDITDEKILAIHGCGFTTRFEIHHWKEEVLNLREVDLANVSTEDLLKEIANRCKG